MCHLSLKPPGLCPAKCCRFLLTNSDVELPLLTVDVRGHRSAAEDAGSYMLLNPAHAVSSNPAGSDYMAMPGVLKVGTVESGAGDVVVNRSSRLPPSLQHHAAAVSLSAPSHASDYMEMATHSAHVSKVTAEPGSKKLPVKKLSTGSRGGDDYMSMQVPKEEGYIDMKNVPLRSTGWP